MLTVEQKFRTVIPAELRNLPEVEYPEEVIRELDIEVEATKAAFAAGELIPLTAAEFAAEVRRRRDKRYMEGTGHKNQIQRLEGTPPLRGEPYPGFKCG